MTASAWTFEATLASCQRTGEKNIVSHSNLNNGIITQQAAWVLAVLVVMAPPLVVAAGKQNASPPPKAAPAKPAPARPVNTPANTPAPPRQVNNPAANGRAAPSPITMDNRQAPRTPTKPGPGAAANPISSGVKPQEPTPNHPVTTVLPGGAVHTRNPDGSTRTVVANKGMIIEHPRAGVPPRVVVNRPDGGQILSQGDHGYVQRPFAFRGQPFARRAMYEHGRVYNQYYAHYQFHGAYLDAYRPGHYYSDGFYRWAGRPWGAPIHYNWGWRSDPWAGYYGYYFAPAPVYAGPSLWLADYLIAASLQASYVAQTTGPAPGYTALTPGVQQQIANEVQRQLQVENAEAQANAHGQVPSGPTGVAALFNDNQPHVFVAGVDLSLQDQSGRPCQISQGDVLQVRSMPAPNIATVDAVVVASKGGPDCVAASSVSVSLTDLQEMQNHMREVSDEGFRELQAKQGQDGIPSAPPEATSAPVAGAFVDAAPAPDTNVAAAITAQNNDASQAEQGAVVAGLRQVNLTQSPAPAPAQSTDQAAGGASVTISRGQSMADVTGIVGQPDFIKNLGARQVYVYRSPPMQVTFVNGRVANIQ